MTIQGGEGPEGTTAKVWPPPSADQQTAGSYGITVVSTPASGGGLGDFGVFEEEPVFTVFINMATAANPNTPSWTLEYAPLHAGDSSGGKTTPPFPSEKVTPVWPADLAARYRSQLAVVFIAIDEAGKVQRVKMMQSPSIALNATLLTAISEWQFHPASQNSKPIAVRALIGVPVWAPAGPVATSARAR
jgi:hypothetical protein